MPRSYSPWWCTWSTGHAVTSAVSSHSGNFGDHRTSVVVSTGYVVGCATVGLFVYVEIGRYRSCSILPEVWCTPVVTVAASVSGLTTVTILYNYVGLSSMAGSSTSLALADDGMSVCRSVGVMYSGRPS